MIVIVCAYANMVKIYTYYNFHFVFCLRTYILFYIYIDVLLKDTHLIETLFFVINSHITKDNMKKFLTIPKGRHLLSLKDFNAPEICELLRVGHEIKSKHANRYDAAAVGKLERYHKPLSGESLAMIFQKRSTRTRVSSETGFNMLGGHALFLGSDDIQLGVNESILDSARVLSRFNSIILARVFGHDDVVEIANESSVPVINALSDKYHPLQILADLMTLQENMGNDLSA